MCGHDGSLPPFPGPKRIKKGLRLRKTFSGTKAFCFCGATRIDGFSPPSFAALPCGLPVTWERPSVHTRKTLSARPLRSIPQALRYRLSIAGGSLQGETSCVLVRVIGLLCLLYDPAAGLSSLYFTRLRRPRQSGSGDFHKSPSLRSGNRAVFAGNRGFWSPRSGGNRGFIEKPRFYAVVSPKGGSIARMKAGRNVPCKPPPHTL